MSWNPRSGYDRLAGCMWLPRLIDKARRFDTEGAAPGDMLGEYMYGNSDYMDAKLLHFLKLTDTEITDVVRAEPDDARAAASIVERSGRTPEQVAKFNRTLTLVEGVFITMIDMDEGRRNAGAATPLFLAAYNAIVFPIGIAIYRFGTAKRRRGGG